MVFAGRLLDFGKAQRVKASVMLIHSSFRVFKFNVQKMINRSLYPLEKWLAHYLYVTSHPPVFIIGSPRSGTTLLYQILLQRYHFAYFSNFMAKFYKIPVFAFWFSNVILNSKKHPVDFESFYGQTATLMGPHEAGRFWYRWFPQGDHIYVPPGTTSESKLQELRQEILAMSAIAKAPVLVKNTYNSMRIAPIIEAFPESCFIVLNRDPLDTAQSILKGRIKFTGHKEQWWALPPKEIDKIRDHPYWEQVVEQVYYVYEQIAHDKARFGIERFYDVEYEKLCKETHDTLKNIASFLRSQGVELRPHGAVPEQFHFSTGQKVGQEDYRLIKEKLEELWD